MKPLYAFLMAIRNGEGTADAEGYNRIVGLANAHMRDLSRHPNIMVHIVRHDATGKETLNVFSSAAGAYQFIFSTWEAVRNKLGLNSFYPADQDAGAIALLSECGALAKINDGDIVGAMQCASSEWASIPGSKAGQVNLTLPQWLRAYSVYLDAPEGST